MQLWDLLEWRQNASAMADTLIMMRGIVLKNSTWFTGLLAVNLALKPLSKKKLGGVSDQNVTPWNMVCTISTAKI